MANRLFKQNSMLTLENKIVHLFATMTIGASGEPTLSDALGVASIARSAAGKYTVTLQDKYRKLRGVLATPLLAGDTALASPNMKVAAHTVDTTKTILLQFHDLSTPSPTELSEGEVWRFVIVLSD